LLGISGGAALGSYVWLATSLATVFEPLGIVAGATRPALTCVGGLLAASVVLGIARARGRGEPVAILLIGVIVHTVIASILLLIYSLDKSRPGSGYFQALLIGELNTSYSLGFVTRVGIAMALCSIGLTAMGHRLNLLLLSEDEARSLGTRLDRIRLIALVVGSVLTALAVMLAGPVGFVGLICPHVARLLVGHDCRRLMLVAPAAGAALLVLADAGSRLLDGQLGTLLSLGVVTSLIGGPVLLWMMLQRDKRPWAVDP
jgi:iron complex transport system permease protein